MFNYTEFIISNTEKYIISQSLKFQNPDFPHHLKYVVDIFMKYDFSVILLALDIFYT